MGSAPLDLPRASNWTVNVDRELPGHVYVSAQISAAARDGWVRVHKHAGAGGSAVAPAPAEWENEPRVLISSPISAAMKTTTRRLFRSAKRCRGQYEWMASYTHSRALSNAVLDPNSPQPLQVLPNLLPMPWDAPIESLLGPICLCRGRIGLYLALADMRTGFPFSVRDQTGLIVGAVDSYRYPLNFDLNFALERMILLRGSRFRAARRRGQPDRSGQSHRGKQRDRHAAVSRISRR